MDDLQARMLKSVFNTLIPFIPPDTGTLADPQRRHALTVRANAARQANDLEGLQAIYREVIGQPRSRPPTPRPPPKPKTPPPPAADPLQAELDRLYDAVGRFHPERFPPSAEDRNRRLWEHMVRSVGIGSQGTRPPPAGDTRTQKGRAGRPW